MRLHVPREGFEIRISTLDLELPKWLAVAKLNNWEVYWPAVVKFFSVGGSAYRVSYISLI